MRAGAGLGVDVGDLGSGQQVTIDITLSPKHTTGTA